MRRTARRGFTIVELLVSLSIAAILLTLVYQVFISQRRTYTAQEGVAEMQQNARIGLETLTRDLQNIGAGVDRDDPQLLHCGPYEIVFYANLDLDQDGATGPAAVSSTINLLYSGGTAVTPAAVPGSTSAETYQIALRSNAGGTYDLVREKRWGGNSAISEVVLDLNISDGTDTVPLFRYWGDFDPADEAADLWGDTNADDVLSAAEVAALTPVTPGAGQTLEDVVQRVEVHLVAETRHADQLSGGKRRNVLRSNVVPRNLWPCPSFGTAPVPPTLTINDLFGGAPITVPFEVTYQNQPDAGRQVFFTLANTNAPPVEVSDSSTASSPETTDATGVATTAITWSSVCADFETFFTGGGTAVTYDLTATIAPFVSPFGTCPATAQTINLSVGPGTANRITANILSDKVSTCGAEDTFDFTATGWNDFGTCSSPTPPVPPVDFDAVTNSGGPGTITDNGILDLAIETFTVTRPAGNNYGTLTGTVFPLSLTSTPNPPAVTYSGGTGALFDTVDIVPWPPYALEWLPTATVGINGTLGPFADCDEVAYSDLFRTRDCAGNYVYTAMDSTPAGFSEGNYQVDGTFVKDAGANAPVDQGGIWSNPDDTIPGDTVTITSSSGGTPPEYDVSYTTPICTLDPAQVPAGINPHIELALSGDAATVNPGPPWTDMQLDSCLDSCITEFSLNGIDWFNTLPITQCDVPTTAQIRVSSCNLGTAPHNTLELVMATSGADAQFPGGFPTTTITLTGQSPSQGTASVEILSATDGAQITVTPWYPNQTDPDKWSCGPATIEITNSCQQLDIYTDPGYSQALTQGASDCLSDISELYFEVEDCLFTAQTAYAAAGGKGLWATTYVNGVEWDKESMDLDPSAIGAGGNSARLRSASGMPFFRDDVAPLQGDNLLTYPSWGTIQVRAQYTDPWDATDDGCDETTGLTAPLPICFPNAITSGGGAGWNGNFNAHWGDVVIRGNVDLPAVPKRVEKLATGQFNGSSFGGAGNDDRFVDVYVGKSTPGDPTTGNYTGLANPDPSTVDQPFIGTNHGNYFRNLSYDKITSMISVIDYDTMKTLAEDRGVYWYTLPGGDVRNPDTGQVAALQTVLTLPGPGLENAYHDGDYIFIDTYGTATTPPNTTGFDIDSTATAALPTFSFNGDLFTEGIVYIAGNAEFGGLGGTTDIQAESPPELELHYDHNTAGWLVGEGQLPIRSDPALPQHTFTVGVHINGALYTDGQLSGSGNPAVFGAVTAERGYQGSGTPEIWYNYNLNVSGENSGLCVNCCTLEVSPNFASVVVGDTVNLNGVAAGGAVEWTIAGNWPNVAGQTVATIGSATGVLTAVNTGWVQVRARDINNCVAYSSVWVASPCDVFSNWSNINPQWPTLGIGDSQRFTVGYTPSAPIPLTWSIPAWSDRSVQIIGSGVAAGQDYVDVLAVCGGTWTTLQATDPGCPWPLEVWTEVACPSACSLNLAAAPTTIPTGGSYTLEANTDLCEVRWELSEGGSLIGSAWGGGTVVGSYASITVDPATPLNATVAGLADTPVGTQVSVRAISNCDSTCNDSATFNVASCAAITVTQNTAGAPLQVGTPYTFTAAGGTEDYTWRVGGASIGSGSFSVSPAPDTEFADFTPSAGGAVTVEVEDANGCTGARAVEVCGLRLNAATATVQVGTSTATIIASGAAGTVNWVWSPTTAGTDLSLSATSGTTTEITGLVNGTATLTATDAGVAGCAADVAVTVNPAPGAWVQLSYDDFEGGWGSFVAGGSAADAFRYTGGTYATGAAALNIQDDTGDDASVILASDLALASLGYTELQVEFQYYAVGMSTGNDFWLQFSSDGGATWSTVATWTEGAEFADDAFYTDTVTILAASYPFSDTVRVRFVCDAQTNNDDVYIDEVRIRAR